MGQRKQGATGGFQVASELHTRERASSLNTCGGFRRFRPHACAGPPVLPTVPPPPTVEQSQSAFYDAMKLTLNLRKQATLFCGPFPADPPGKPHFTLTEFLCAQQMLGEQQDTLCVFVSFRPYSKHQLLGEALWGRPSETPSSINVSASLFLPSPPLPLFSYGIYHEHIYNFTESPYLLPISPTES